MKIMQQENITTRCTYKIISSVIIASFLFQDLKRSFLKVVLAGILLPTLKKIEEVKYGCDRNVSFVVTEK